MSESELLNKLADIYKKAGVPQEKAYNRAYICLKNAARAGAVKRFKGKVVYLRCKHEKDVVKGLEVLLYTLDRLEGRTLRIKATLTDLVSECKEYKEYLHQKYNIIALEEVERLMKISLEHLITSEYLTISYVPTIRYDSTSSEPVLLRIATKLTIESEDLYKLKTLLLEVRDKMSKLEKSVEGFCRECKDLKEKEECHLIEVVDRVVNIIISSICPRINSASVIESY